MNQNEKITYWQGVIREQKESGLSVASFCRNHHLAEWKFYYWRRRDNAPLKLNDSSGFVELDFSSHPPGLSGITLRINNIEIELNENFSSDCLKRVLEVTG